MAEEVFNTYVLTPPASPVPEEVADDSARDAEGSAVEGETGADDDLGYCFLTILIFLLNSFSLIPLDSCPAVIK